MRISIVLIYIYIACNPFCFMAVMGKFIQTNTQIAAPLLEKMNIHLVACTHSALAYL